jgi:hypothetical protein
VPTAASAKPEQSAQNKWWGLSKRV